MSDSSAKVKDLAGRLAAGAAAAGAAIAAQRALEAGYRARKGTEPPSKNPLDRDSSLKDALVWTLVMAGTVTTARIVARKVAQRLLTRDDAPDAQTVA